jgi:hypothetical protein
VDLTEERHEEFEEYEISNRQMRGEKMRQAERNGRRKRMEGKGRRQKSVMSE